MEQRFNRNENKWHNNTFREERGTPRGRKPHQRIVLPRKSKYAEVIMEKKVDLNTWERKEIFDFFSEISNPFYMVSFRQNVSRLYKYTKQNHISFYYALVYLCTKAINSIPAFHYAIRQSEIYYLPERIPSFTDMKKDSEFFHIVTMPCEDSMIEFCNKAGERSQRQSVFLEKNLECDSLIYFSCIPWVDVTALTNERDMSAPQAKDDAIPRITWGKYVSSGDQLELGMSIEVNHRLVDGIHIGQFAEALTRSIEELL